MKKVVYILFLISFISFSQSKKIFDIARNGTLDEIIDQYKINPKVIDSINNQSFSPLILACYNNNVDVALFLIEHTANINYSSNLGNALMAAVMKGNIVIIEALIKQNIHINNKDNDGNTALHFATLLNHNLIVRLLLKAGANKESKNNLNETAFDIAKRNNNTELIILLDL